MSEASNIEFVRSLYSAFSRGDVPFILERVQDTASWVCHGESVVPWVGTYRGRDQIRRFFTAISENIDVNLWEPGEFVVQGDRVVSMGLFGGKVKKTGRPVRTKWIFVWTVKDGKVHDYEQWHDEGLAVGFHA